MYIFKDIVSAPIVNQCSWKTPTSTNGLTPARMNKNNMNIELNQFSTNPTPYLNIRGNNGKGGANMGKGLTRMTYL